MRATCMVGNFVAPRSSVALVTPEAVQDLVGRRSRTLLARVLRGRRIDEPYAGAGAPGTGSVGMRFTSLYSR